MSAINGAEALAGVGGGSFHSNISSSADRRQNSDANSESTNEQPSAKKQRTVYLDGPPEDKETAEKKLADAGFERGNFSEVHDFGEDYYLDKVYNPHSQYCTPLIHFCRKGDVKMCRYLLKKGASVHETCDENEWNPMYAASSSIGSSLENHHKTKLDICKLLFRNGAHINPYINPYNGSNITPLSIWANDNTNKCIEECKWFIRNGALTDDDGNISESALRRDLQPKRYLRWDTRTDLLSWAEEALQIHRALKVFLLGTLPLRSSRQNSSSQLTGLSGKAGILEHIGNYVGVVRGGDLRLFRQLAPLLAQYISDMPHRPY